MIGWLGGWTSGQVAGWGDPFLGDGRARGPNHYVRNPNVPTSVPKSGPTPVASHGIPWARLVAPPCEPGSQAGLADGPGSLARLVDPARCIYAPMPPCSYALCIYAPIFASMQLCIHVQMNLCTFTCCSPPPKARGHSPKDIVERTRGAQPRREGQDAWQISISHGNVPRT